MMRRLSESVFVASVLTMPAFGQTFDGFAPPQSFAVGTGPREVAIGDFNGDGVPDLATPNATANSISVLIGNGDGTFRAAVHYPVGATPLTIEAADLDGDGDMDITVANGNTPGFSVLHGAGDGTFVTHQTIVFDIDAPPFPGVFMAHTMADFDGDGDIDIAVQSLTANVLMILPNDGSGTFGTFYVIHEDTTFTFPTDLEPADLDSDGDIDLVVTLGTAVRIYLNNGDGTFAPSFQFTMSGHDIMAPLADLNGDGIIDIATNTTVNPDGFISIALGNGDGSFGSVTNYPTNRPSGITSSDLNYDGYVDLAVTSYSPFNTVSVMLGNAGGTFGAPLPFATGGNNPEGVAAVDLDGDGVLDLVASNRGGSFVSVFINLTEMPDPCPADYNGDTIVDVLDFLDFFDDFGTCDGLPGPCGAVGNADFNGDTLVDVLDFLDFFDAFGTGC